MAIKFSKYIDITSGVGGAAAAARRDMGMRVFTSSDVLTYGTVLTCNDADEVMSIFGSTSAEYKIAVNYFGYISNSITKANQISFVKWANNAIKQTTITAGDAPSDLEQFTGKIGVCFESKDAGSLGVANVKITIGDGEVAESYEKVADMFTAAMLKMSESYAWLKGSSCDYVKGRYVFTFTASAQSATGPDIVVGAYGGEDDDVVSAIGLMGFGTITDNTWDASKWSSKPSTVSNWAATTAYVVGDWVKSSDVVYCCKTAHTSGSTFVATNWVMFAEEDVREWSGKTAYSVGDFVEHSSSYCCCKTAISAPTPSKATQDKTVAIAAETPVAAVSRVEATENNFGSFMFVEDLDIAKMTKLAEWAHAKNYEYQYWAYCTYDGTVSYDALSAALKGYTCVNMTFCNRRDEYPEFMPAALFASTDYTRVNSTKTFMFKQFAGVNPSVGLKTDPTVSGNALYKALDSARVNYYGQTMKSGKSLCFYQDGNNADGTETSVACNEIWMKDAIKTELINLLIAMEKVPANDKGLAMVTMQIQGVLNEALANGTICPGKTLTNTQKQYIDSVAGVSEAYKTVVNDGYWFGISLKTDNSAGYTKYKADYTLIYSKGDAIRKVTGSDIMI